MNQSAVSAFNYAWDILARASIGQFLEKVYNEKRLHSALQYLSPSEFERRQGRGSAEAAA